MLRAFPAPDAFAATAHDEAREWLSDSSFG
jgi:hypothetical protein